MADTRAGGAPPPTYALSYRQLLGTAEVRALLLATLLSRLAGRMFALAIVLYALVQMDSPMLAGWLAFSAMAPGLAISPVAGALIDRVGSVWAITVDMAASAACVAALIAADMFGWASAPVLLTLTSLFSLTSPLSAAGIRALLPRLVPVTALDRVNALDTAIHGLTDIVGPASAGAIVGFAGPASALGMIAVIYAAAALCVGSIRRPRGQLPRVGPLLTQAWSGLQRVIRQPTLRGLAVAYSLYEVSWGVLVVVVPVFAARQFAGGMGATVAGLLWACLGLVGGIAALVAGHRRIAGRERRVMALGMLVTSLAAWPVAAEFGLAGLVLGMMLVGAAAGPIDVGVLTLRQRRTDPAELGRVLSVSMSLNMAGGPLGAALAGVLVTWSLSATFAVAALASALAAAAVALIPRHDE
ncbi:MAG TPA: MFS transporter [Acetobacteraceae bacterium]|nr:MFS transporter [Acetobacteraceae bacterium]